MCEAANERLPWLWVFQGPFGSLNGLEEAYRGSRKGCGGRPRPVVLFLVCFFIFWLIQLLMSFASGGPMAWDLCNRSNWKLSHGYSKNNMSLSLKIAL